LTSAGNQDIDVGLEQNRKVLISEGGTKLLIKVRSEVRSFVNSFSNLDGLITLGIHLAEALSGLSFDALLLVGPKKIHKIIVRFESSMKKINFEK